MSMEDKYRVIGIAGKKFSGKDTLGSYFVNNYEYEQIAYADPLKEIGTLFGFNNEQLYGSKKEVVDEFWEITPRMFLQFVGTDLFRNNSGNLSHKMGENTWTNIVKKKIQENHNKHFIITDVRFPNEAALIKELGGIIIKLNRHSEYNDTHASESQIDDLPADFIFENNSSKEDLYNEVTKTLGIPLLQTFSKEAEHIKKKKGSIIKPQKFNECDFDCEKEQLIDSLSSTGNKHMGDEIKKEIDEFKASQNS